jgi:cell division protein FtsQ
MWHRPQLLNTLADLLFAAGAAMLLAAFAVWVLRMPFAPIRAVEFDAPLVHVQATDIEEALQGRLRGNFLSLSLDGVRSALETVPWVRHAAVRRVWPDRLVVHLEEHRPLARWGESGSEWVNDRGEVFAGPATRADLAPLPQLMGPAGTAPELLRRYAEMRALLSPLQRRPVRVALSARLALSLQLDDGMRIELGREQARLPAQARLQRFVGIYPQTVAGRVPMPRTVDLRYPNGFALYPAGTLLQSRGKE